MSHPAPPLILTRSIALLLAAGCSAGAVDWIGGTSNDWNVGVNWTGGVVPMGPAVDAYIGIPGGAGAPFTATISADIPQMRDINPGIS